MTTCSNLFMGNLYGLLLVLVALVYVVVRVIAFFRPSKAQQPSARLQPPAIVRVGEALVLACALVVVAVAIASCLR
jgi:hypothetical protein